MRKVGSKKWLIGLGAAMVVIIGTVLLVPHLVQAAPAPYKVVVNRETKQCGLIFGGDECMDCFPPEGWEVLGYETETECPADYSLVDVEYTCIPFKNEFCCTEGHSGAHGDCEDMVVSRLGRSCAFVEDIQGCELPSGWKAKPENTEVYDWFCPGPYEWQADLACETTVDEPSGAEDGVNFFPRIGLAEVFIIAGVGILCLAGVAVIVVVAVILLRRKK